MGTLRRARTLVVWLTALGAVLAACRREPPPEPRSPARRIVAVTPSITEILFVLGLGDRVVGVGDFSTWPPEVEEKTRIGGLFDARFEAIVALEADLAVLLPSEEELARRLGELGIEVLTVQSETLEDVEESVRAIAGRTGAVGAAEAFLDRWRRQLAPASLPLERRVLLSLAREPGRLGQVLTAGPDTFLDELLERLGARNVFADAPVRYPQVGAEEILRRRPQAIIELQPDAVGDAEREQLAADWRNLLGPAALGGGCVRILEGDHLLLPGPRLPRVYRELREAIAGCEPAGP